MGLFLILLAFVAFNVGLGLVVASDLRPQSRPPQWSVGRLMAPRR